MIDGGQYVGEKGHGHVPAPEDQRVPGLTGRRFSSAWSRYNTVRSTRLVHEKDQP